MKTIKTITLKEIKDAYKDISPFVYKTPVITNKEFDRKHGRNFYFKCENMQRTGSFKIRGAMNAVIQLKKKSSDVTGVSFQMATFRVTCHSYFYRIQVTHSSGNHGQAVALAAQTFKVPCTIVTPRTSPDSKKNAILTYGADLVLCEPTVQSRVEIAKEIELKYGHHYISSCDDYDVITGQGSIGLEFVNEIPDLDAILVTACGGGMSAGTCIAAKGINPKIKVFIVEPEGKMLEACLRAGERQWPNPPIYLDTIADGLRQQQLGYRNWPIILDLAEKDVFTMNDEEIMEGTRVAFEDLKVVVEPSAGACVAAAMSTKLKDLDPNLKNIGVILCGGNADLHKIVSKM